MTRIDDVRRTQALGLVGVVVVLSFIAVSLGVYRHAFSDAVEITVTSDRAGLLLEPGVEVKALGVRIGEVRAADSAGDGVRITVAIDEDKVRYVPEDATATIEASSALGGKQVVLEASGAVAAAPVAAGDVVPVTAVTPEINDLFQGLTDVLTAVPVDELASTLTTTSRALEGQGSRLGAFLTALNDYVRALNGHSPQLEADLRLAAPVLNTYAEVAPELTAVLRNATVTGSTVVARQEDLRALLGRFGGLAEDGTALTERIGTPLVRSLEILRPVTGLLSEYSPQFPCFLTGFSYMATKNSVLGTKKAGGQFVMTFLPGQEQYQYPRDLPRFVSGAGPQCYSLPDVGIGNDRGGPKRRKYADGQHVYDGNGDSQNYELSPTPIELFLGQQNLGEGVR